MRRKNEQIWIFMETMKKDTHRQEFCKKLDIFIHTFLMSLDLSWLTLLDTPLEHSSAHPRDDIEAAPRLLLLGKQLGTTYWRGRTLSEGKRMLVHAGKRAPPF